MNCSNQFGQPFATAVHEICPKLSLEANASVTDKMIDEKSVVGEWW